MGLMKMLLGAFVMEDLQHYLSLDDGYYGKGSAHSLVFDFASGIYFTSSIQYAIPYVQNKKKPSLLISLIVPGKIQHKLYLLVHGCVLPGACKATLNREFEQLIESSLVI